MPSPFGTLRRHAAVALCAVLAGCAQPPAPKDTDALSRWFFVHAMDGRADYPGALANLHAAYGDIGLLDPAKNTLEPLQPGDVDDVGFPGRDPSDADGMLLVNAIPCTLPQIMDVVVRQDQKVVHPSYESYTRTFDGDVDAWIRGETQRIAYDNVYTLSGLGGKYTAHIRAEARVVPAWTEGAGPKGPVLIVRAALAEPATVEAEGDFFAQDYQAQVFYERAPGEVVHLYAAWKDQRFAGFDSDSDVYRAVTLDNLAGADERYAAHCR